MIESYLQLFAEYVPNQYMRALIIFVILTILTRVVLQISIRTLTHFASKTTTDLDDILIKKLTGPVTIVASLVSFVISVNTLTLDPAAMNLIDSVSSTIIVFVVAYTIYEILIFLLDRYWFRVTADNDTLANQTILNLIHNVLTVIFMVIAILYILRVWGIEITPLLTGLGIAGLAVALAIQPILSNTFNGISLILGNVFKIGDVVKINNDIMGVVHSIGLRVTRIKTFDSEMIILPNSKVAEATIQNFYQPDRRVRVGVEFGVEYGVDPEYVKQLAIEEVSKIDFIDKNEQIRVLFTDMGDSSLDFKVMFWVDDIAEKWPANQEAMTRIYRRLYKEGIGIPFPQQTVWLRDEGKAQSSSPFDRKFKKTNTKYFSQFGHVKEKKQEPAPEKKKTIKKKKS
ncbi:MAG: mechanosensitive ion channel family protein [Candidatus Woesearchaeota archaeon]